MQSESKRLISNGNCSLIMLEVASAHLETFIENVPSFLIITLNP